MKKQSFLIGAFLLAIGGFLAKAIGALYKIPLANILGSNGMGVYYLIFPIYSMLLVLISSGVSIAVSKMVAYERSNNNRKNQIIIFKVSVIYVFVLSLAFALLMVILSNQIAFIQGNTNAKLGYFAIAPALVFASLISVVRAYFQGLENMIPTSLSNVFEQIVKLVFGLILSNMLISKGIEYAVFGAIIAVTISEFVAFLLILINFLYYKSKNKIYERKPITSAPLTNKSALKKLMRYSLPATLSSLIIPITGFLDSFMVINLLISSGHSSAISTSLYGILSGIINTLVSLPVIFTMALSTAIVPNLSGFHAKNNEREVSLKSSFFIKVTWLFALVSFVLLLILSPDIIEILYSRGLSDKVINEFDFAHKLLMVASVSVIYYAFLQTFTSILQSINRPILPFISLFVALFIRIILVIVLVKIPEINIFGVVIANIIFLTIATIINLMYLRRYIKIELSFLRFFAVPVFSAVITACVVMALKMMLHTKVIPLVYTLICGVAGVVVYVLLLYVLKVFSKQELKLFPGIKKVTKNKKRKV